MTSSTLMMTYLHDVLRDQRMTSDELAYELDYPDRTQVETWLKGWEKPTPAQLPKLAKALRIDPVDLAVGWLADAVPELEPHLVSAVLQPRGSTFPTSADLTLRAPFPRPAFIAESMDVGDPHDELRHRIGVEGPLESSIGLRKRAHRRLRPDKYG